MLKPLELRVSDMEDLIADIPHLVNLRLEGVMSSLHETNSRIALIDRQFSAMKTDVSSMKTDTAGMKSDIAGLKSDIAKIDVGLSQILSRLPQA